MNALEKVAAEPIGSWLTVQAQAVDFLYRDLQKVESIIEDCLRGQVDIVYLLIGLALLWAAVANYLGGRKYK